MGEVEAFIPPEFMFMNVCVWVHVKKVFEQSMLSLLSLLSVKEWLKMWHSIHMVWEPHLFPGQAVYLCVPLTPAFNPALGLKKSSSFALHSAAF